jgi:hypothetical protein
MALAKPPPPPPIAAANPELNRWFLAVTAFLKNNGTIDGGNIDGFPELVAEVAAQQISITTLNGEVATLNGEVAANTANIATNTANITANATAITALQARAQLLNGSGAPGAGLGNDNDWYAATGATKHIYVKLAGAWVQIV